MQAIPRGQYEAASAIGLTYWQSTRRIVLPQALRIVIPALMNDIIRAFKNTTFVSIIGMFDVLGATKAALQDLRWISYVDRGLSFSFSRSISCSASRCRNIARVSSGSWRRDAATDEPASCRRPDQAGRFRENRRADAA